MKYLKILAIFFFTGLGVISQVAAQESIENSWVKPEQPDFYPINMLDLFKKEKLTELNKINNHIFISQIGEGNTVNTNISSENINLNYSQIGIDNAVNLNISAQTLNQKIFQEGFGNTVFDFVSSKVEDTSLILSQNGDNLLFEKYGTNSISDKLTFKMEGRDSSIIIRNYK